MANNREIIIQDWASGMAASPNMGNGLIRNCTIDTETGALMPNYAPTVTSPVPSSSTFTVDTGTDICTLTGTFTELTKYTAVTFTSTTTLPAPLVAGTVYYLTVISGSTFKIATTLGNALSNTGINLTTTGTGTHTMATVNIGVVKTIYTHIDSGTTTFDAFENVSSNPITFYQDQNGRVWFRDRSLYNEKIVLLDGNTLTDSSGKGLCSLTSALDEDQFLFVFRDSNIDVCKIQQANRLDPVGTGAWTNNWESMLGIGSSGINHKALLGDDNIVYFCDSNYVGSIAENPGGGGFDPASSATYTFNNNALDLPVTEMAEDLEQLGQNLLIAGGTFNRIYPWDRVSDSFGLPIYCAETGVYRLKNISNTIYILNGQRGNIYKTQGAIVTPVAKLPEYAIGNPTFSNYPFNKLWGGIASKNGNLVFGVGAPNNTTNAGIWMMYPDGRLVIDAQSTDGGEQVYAIEQKADEFYSFGFDSGINRMGASSERYGSFGAVFQSALFVVQDKITKGTFSRLEAQLDQPTSGSSSVIRISYRTNLTSSFTTLATFTTDGSTTSFTQDIGLTDIEKIQIQIEMTGTGNNTEALKLKSVTLYP